MANVRVRVTIDKSKVNKLVGPSGPVDPYTRAQAVKVASVARRLVGVKSGKLRSSIRVSPSRRPSYNVEARAPYALFHHEGTRPHDIGSPVLIEAPDTWRYIGRSPAGKGKRHPGTKPNRFLTDAARRVGLRTRVKSGR